MQTAEIKPYKIGDKTRLPQVYYQLVKRRWNAWQPIIAGEISGSLPFLTSKRVDDKIVARWIVRIKY